MAANRDKVEKSLDRLERLFSKGKKGSIARNSLFRPNKPRNLTSPSPAAQQTNPEPPLFPSPSFLRPTTTRMRARDEVIVTVRSPGRAHSLPETPNSHGRMPSIDESSTRSIASLPSIGSYPKVPRRSASLLHRRRDPSIAGLLEFSFTEKRVSARNTISTRSTSLNFSTNEAPSPSQQLDRIHPRQLGRLEEALPVFPSRRPDTPPHLDSGDFILPTVFHFNKPLPPSPPDSDTNSEPSPKLRAVVTEYTARRTAANYSGAKMRSQKHRSLEAPVAPSAGTSSLRKTVSDSTLSRTTPAPKSDFALQEPTVETFMGLSDDDIADGRPVTPPPSRVPKFSLPPDPPVFQMPSPISRRGSPLISLSSPLASRPAAAAAFEAARIAQRFKFDLIYIVNLWPTDLGSASSSISSPDTRPASRHTRTRSRTPSNGPARRSTLTGRLLAAYGLSSLHTPFTISPEVHAMILRQEGWLEYRSEHPRPDVLSRGYSCAFYAGSNSDATAAASHQQQQQQQQQQQPGTPTEAGPASPKSKRPSRRLNNRGIVFAAYRLPNPDGTILATDGAQLEALHQEAETLVEMLLDIHKTQRSRQHAGRPGTEETGPLPVRPQFSPYHA